MIKWILKGLAIVVILVCSFLAYLYLYPVNLDGAPVTVMVESGDTYSGVTQELVDKGVVRSGTILKFVARLTGNDKTLIPGRYDFSGKTSSRSVLRKLSSGDFLRVRVTVWEGVPLWKVASALSAKLPVDSTDLWNLNADSAFLDSMNLDYLEGYLYPETYIIPWHQPLRQVVREMVELQRRMTDSLTGKAAPNDLDWDQVITLASIVEAEALMDDEMPRIASVYHNRLRKNMRLDADPTVIYGLGGLDRPLTRSDLRQETPYNTYRMKGLPPTPINSPGLAAIRAVLYPESTDYLFFVADGSGYHRFSRTNSEHNRARREIRRALQEREN